MMLYSKVNNRVRYYYRQYILRDPFTCAHAKWVRDRGDETLRVTYPLSSDSVVFDIGGYLGDWCNEITKKYDCHVYVFEPVPEYYGKIVSRFSNNPKVKVFNFGLGNRDESLNITLLNDGTSTYKSEGVTIPIQLKDIVAFSSKQGINRIDLLKVNIEGGEYVLLRQMLAYGMIQKCTDIQVQFHNFVKNAALLRESIRKELEITHKLTYDYPFVWENWRQR